MIIDGHAYCFPSLAGANGFPSAREHLQYIQREMADHHQPVWRLRDGAPGDNGLLADPGDPTVRGLRDVGFRVQGHGRFVWTCGEDDYAKQYLPPYLKDLEHPPEMLVAQMDHAGIDRAVLHATPIMGFLNDYLAECVRCYPERLWALASIREWDIEHHPDACAAEVERAYANGLSGLQFLVNGRYRYGVRAPWNGEACAPFWDAVTALARPIFFTIAPPCPASTLDDYLQQLRMWRDWLEAYPDVPVVLTHGFHWRFFLEGDALRLREEVFEPFEASSAKLELLFPIALGDRWQYPFGEARPIIEQLCERLGPERLVWGTDMPNVERYCTYRQTLDAYRVHLRDVLSTDALDQILGGSIASVFDTDEPEGE